MAAVVTCDEKNGFLTTLVVAAEGCKLEMMMENMTGGRRHANNAYDDVGAARAFACAAAPVPARVDEEAQQQKMSATATM